MFDLDTTLFLWLNATSASPAWVLALARFASLQLPQLLIAGTVGALIVGDGRVRRLVARIAFAMAVAWVLARIGHYLWPMPRPFVLGIGTAWIPHSASTGFPSMHSSVACAFAFAVAMFSGRWSMAALGLLAASLVAWSRVCLGLHFPTDVGAGALVGLLGALSSRVIPDFVPSVRTAHD